MQPFDKPSSVLAGEDACAAQLLDTILPIMRTLRKEMRSRRPAGLSVPQFRVLAFLYHHDGASLSDLADHVGVTLPTMSRVVDGLAARDMVIREPACDDRRRVVLRVTGHGRELFDAAARGTRARLSESLSTLSSKERETVLKAMALLQLVFKLPAAKPDGHSVRQRESP